MVPSTAQGRDSRGSDDFPEGAVSVSASLFDQYSPECICTNVQIKWSCQQKVPNGKTREAAASGVDLTFAAGLAAGS
jgi:hypothetical protein